MSKFSLTFHVHFNRTDRVIVIANGCHLFEFCFIMNCRIYGPNSEIEWNKEGSRGFLIINRKPSQTALSAVSDKVGALGESLNKQLKDPCKTERDSHLKIDDDANASHKIVMGNPTKV